MNDVPAELYIGIGGTLIAVVLLLIWLDPTTRRKK
jgi:hypothetical protein